MTVHGASLAKKIHHAHPAPRESAAPGKSSAAASFGSGPAATLELSSKAQQTSADVADKEHDGDAK